MKFITLTIILIFINSDAQGYDCSGKPPFNPGGSIDVQATVSRYIWNHGNPEFEDVCVGSTSINWFDVRGREEEAYYCLKPAKSEIMVCKTKLGGDSAKIDIISSSWIRDWKSEPIREYRFHAYVTKMNNPGFYYDIFSRALSFILDPQPLVVEGSLRTGPSNPEDGFWIRLDFKK
jgi:hypothetical protein